MNFLYLLLDDNWLADEHLGKLSGDDGDVVRGRRVIRGRWRCSFPEQEKLHILKQTRSQKPTRKSTENTD